MDSTKEYFSLKWSNFRSSLTEGFHDFLQEETMVDVTLAAEGKFVQAHKLVLSVCSPYFKNLFKVNPCKHPIVILKDVGHNDLSYMLEFMYKGEVGVKHEDLPSFLKLADTLKVKGLTGEKLQKNEGLSKDLDSNMARVRKKVNRESVYDVNKENSECEQLGKKVMRNKRRRLSYKSEAVKKLKSDKCYDSGDNKCERISSDNLSEDECNNSLIKFIDGDNVKSGEHLKQSEPQCDNENESQCDNKTDFIVWEDDVPDSDDSGGPDINSFFQSDYSEETEQTPQGASQTQLQFGLDSVKLSSEKCRITQQHWGFSSSTPSPLRLIGRHFIEYIPPTASKDRPTRQCKVCCSQKNGSGKRIRKETRYYCPDCDVGLCIECFKIYHTKNIY